PPAITTGQTRQREESCTGAAECSAAGCHRCFTADAADWRDVQSRAQVGQFGADHPFSDEQVSLVGIEIVLLVPLQ
ncbi:MAG: hypothetical protein ABJC51_04235, partial [Acidobacteriota bacterium]